MQINPSAIVPNAAGDASAKSAEIFGTGGGDAFFSQMGEILKQNGETADVQPGAVASLSSIDASPKWQQAFLPGTVSPRSQVLDSKKNPIEGIPSAILQFLQMTSGIDSDQGEGNSAPGNAEMHPGKTPAIKIVTEQIQIGKDQHETENMQADVQASVDGAVADVNPRPSISFEPGVPAEILLPLQKDHNAIVSTVKNGSEADERSAGISQKQASGHTTVTTKAASMLVTAPAESELALSHNFSDRESPEAAAAKPVRIVRSDSSADSVQLNLDFGAAGTPDSGPGRAKPSRLTEGTRDADYKDIPVLFKDADTKNDASSEAPARKLEKTFQLSAENHGARNAAPEQGQNVVRPGMSAAVQEKTQIETSRLNRPPLSDVHNQSEMPQALTSTEVQSRNPVDAQNTQSTQTSSAHKTEFIFQLADQIRIQVHEGKGEIRIQLKPDSFGRLEIKAENTAYGLSARITTESDIVKSYLENNLQALQQTLQDQGLKIDRIHIVVQDAFDSQSSSGFNAQFGHAGSGQDGRESQSSSAKNGAAGANPSEDIALDSASRLALNPNSRFYTVA